MALKARIAAVAFTAGGEDLSLAGRFRLSVEYFDDGQPGVVLLATSFDLPSDVQVADAVARVQAYGRRVRDARARVAQLQPQVGATIDIT